MSNVQPAAPATRNRRSDRHAPAKQVTPLPPAPSKKPAAKPGAGKFPVRTCIVLGMVLIICILALGIARGNLNRLHKERENAAAEYQKLADELRQLGAVFTQAVNLDDKELAMWAAGALSSAAAQPAWWAREAADNEAAAVAAAAIMKAQQG